MGEYSKLVLGREGRSHTNGGVVEGTHASWDCCSCTTALNTPQNIDRDFTWRGSEGSEGSTGAKAYFEQNRSSERRRLGLGTQA